MTGPRSRVEVLESLLADEVVRASHQIDATIVDLRALHDRVSSATSELSRVTGDSTVALQQQVANMIGDLEVIEATSQRRQTELAAWIAEYGGKTMATARKNLIDESSLLAATVAKQAIEVELVPVAQRITKEVGTTTSQLVAVIAEARSMARTRLVAILLGGAMLVLVGFMGTAFVVSNRTVSLTEAEQRWLAKGRDLEHGWDRIDRDTRQALVESMGWKMGEK